MSTLDLGLEILDEGLIIFDGLKIDQSSQSFVFRTLLDSIGCIFRLLVVAVPELDLFGRLISHGVLLYAHTGDSTIIFHDGAELFLSNSA